MKVTVTSSSAEDTPYCPLNLGNGDISLMTDYSGGTPLRNSGKAIHENGIWRAGFRTDSPGFELLSFGTLENVTDEPSQITEWRQTLHVTDAASESECTYASGVKIRSYLYCHLNHNLIVIRKEISGTEKISMRFTFAPVRTNCIPMNSIKTAYHIDAWGGISGTVAFFSPDEGVTAKRTGSEILLTAGSASTVFYLAMDEEAELFARSHTEPEIHASHLAAWTEFWKESRVPADKLPGKVLEVARVAEYHLRISSTKWSIPTAILPRHWAGKYFAFDEFFAMEGLLAAGHLKLAQKVPLFRFSQLEQAKKRAHSYFGKVSSAAKFNWETLEKSGIEGAPPGFWLEHIFHMANVAVGAWHCSLNGKDQEFLEKIAYPLIRACAEYYRIFAVYEKEKGRFVIGKCTDLERLGPARENPFMTTCGAITTFRLAAKGAQLLGTDPELCGQWAFLAQKLTESLPQDEGVYLVYPGCKENSIGLFSGIFPYENLSSDDPKQLRAIQNFCSSEKEYGNMYPLGKSICTWYAGWKAVTFARLGKKEIARTVVRQMAEDTGSFSEIYEICENRNHPWFCTAEGIYLQAVCESFR